MTQEDIINIINRAKMTRIEEFKSEDNQHILYVFTYIFEVKRLLEEAKNNVMAIIVCSSGH